MQPTRHATCQRSDAYNLFVSKFQAPTRILLSKFIFSTRWKQRMFAVAMPEASESKSKETRFVLRPFSESLPKEHAQRWHQIFRIR